MRPRRPPLALRPCLTIVDLCGLLRRAGCQVLSAHGIDQHPRVIVDRAPDPAYLRPRYQTRAGALVGNIIIEYRRVE